LNPYKPKGNKDRGWKRRRGGEERSLTLTTSQAAQITMQCFITGIVFPLEGRLSEI